MYNLIKNCVLVFLFAATMTSCGKNYNFEKVVINNTDKEIIVQYDCCGNEKQYTIPANEQEVVFVCTYQSYKKPDCSSVEGEFSWTYSEIAEDLSSENASLRQDITTSESWTFEENGKNLSCVFVLETE